MPITDAQGKVIGPKNLGNINYEYDFHSGSQINVMLGDVLIDSAVAINFTKTQSKTPVYGYASQYYSFVADGHVFVQGSLAIAFKEAGYLLWPIQKYNNRTAEILTSFKDNNYEKVPSYLSGSPRYSVNENGDIINSYEPEEYTLTEAALAAERKRVMEANVEQMFEWDQYGGPEGDPAKRKEFNKFWRELEALPDDKFEYWAETFEDSIWYGSDQANPFVRDKLFSNNIRKGQDITTEDVLQHRTPDQYPEVDIWIISGDMSHQSSNHTVNKLLDVSFTGNSRTIEVSGQPVIETYQFIARNFI